MGSRVDTDPHQGGHRRAADKEAINNRYEQIESSGWRPSTQQPLVFGGGQILVYSRVATCPQAVALLFRLQRICHLHVFIAVVTQSIVRRHC